MKLGKKIVDVLIFGNYFLVIVKGLKFIFGFIIIWFEVFKVSLIMIGVVMMGGIL